VKPFRERDPVLVGLAGFCVVVLMLVAAFRADRLPVIGAGERYTAEFAEVGTLSEGAEVRVAGVSVGRVTDIALDGPKAVVTFTVSQPMDLGRRTGAAIRIRTLLGAQYLALLPDGAGRLPPGGVIQLARTQAPYDVVQAFTDLGQTTGRIDVDQLSQALESISDVAARTPGEFRAAIAGVSRLSSSLAARDDQLNTLLTNLRRVTGTVNARDAQLERLVDDGDVLFRAVVARRVAVQRVLVSTRRLSDEIRVLAEDTRADLRPALASLDRVTGMLRRNADSLDRALTLFPAFGRTFANALGVGPWFDGYVQF
jgi:phospholipid/cholesterol/gamma-HCH transport system substrate-binding protein